MKKIDHKENRAISAKSLIVIDKDKKKKEGEGGVD